MRATEGVHRIETRMTGLPDRKGAHLEMILRILPQPPETPARYVEKPKVRLGQDHAVDASIENILISGTCSPDQLLDRTVAKLWEETAAESCGQLAKDVGLPMEEEVRPLGLRMEIAKIGVARDARNASVS